MFVVRRPFRNYNQMMLPGTVVVPGNVKWFKTRVKDNLIVEVAAHNIDIWEEYFTAKYGVSIKHAFEEATKPVKAEAPAVAKANTSKPKANVKTAEAKPKLS